jgi:hypothetical protein
MNLGQRDEPSVVLPLGKSPPRFVTNILLLT